jgi:hypothetical protein
MNMDDIRNKWLFVGYSSKVDTDSEGNIKENKNRKKQFRRSYAGAKGVGRFACDRLGAMLTLYSKKKGDTEIKLVVPWDAFEEEIDKEF